MSCKVFVPHLCISCWPTSQEGCAYVSTAHVWPHLDPLSHFSNLISVLMRLVYITVAMNSLDQLPVGLAKRKTQCEMGRGRVCITLWMVPMPAGDTLSALSPSSSLPSPAQAPGLSVTAHSHTSYNLIKSLFSKLSSSFPILNVLPISNTGS